MNFDSLIRILQETHNVLYASAAKAINTSMTVRNWLYGFYIVEFEQNGEDRAKYGENLLNELSINLSVGLKGISVTNLRLFRQFYLLYPEIASVLPAFNSNFLPGPNHQALSDDLPRNDDDLIRQALSDEFQVIDVKAIQHVSKVISADKKTGLPPARLLQTLSFSHIVELIKINDQLKRAFYEIECVKGTWSTRELKRQIESLYFERSGLSKDKKKLSEVLNLKAVQLVPGDLIKDPMTIEFLGINDRAMVTESDLEQALLDHLQMFLLELGYGFCFEARQKRILIDGEYYFIDLVFYHRILKCHVLVDLKMEKFKHGHAGQMNTYLNYFRNEVMHETDNPPVGILLCTDKGDTLVKYATTGLDKNIFVNKYMVALPSKEELENYISREMQ